MDSEPVEVEGKWGRTVAAFKEPQELNELRCVNRLGEHLVAEEASA